ncbi:MAG: PD40 domain-containing protein [Flavobacterium sp.]|nr:PD40 domain-containing protein [Flavobacterium sp.]
MKKYFVIAGMALLCLSFTGTETETEKVSNGRIVFASDMDGNFELYSIQNNGSDLQRLTSDLGIDAHPCYSPDGKNIAFTGQRNGKFDIYLITAEGGEPIQITKHNGTNMVPCFSPNGKKIVYESNADGNYELYSISLDGSNRKQLTHTEAPIQNIGPKYAGDGTRIAFASNREGEKDTTNDIYILNTTDGSCMKLTENMDNAEGRSWSPNDKEIVFNSLVNGVGQLFVVDVKSKKMKQLTSSEGNPNPFAPGGVFPVIKGEVTPHWTPDGKKIIFASDRNNRYDLYQMNPDGSEVTRLTKLDYFSLSPHCQPIQN